MIVFRSLMAVKTYPGDVEDMTLTFCRTQDVLGEIKVSWIWQFGVDATDVIRTMKQFSYLCLISKCYLCWRLSKCFDEIFQKYQQLINFENFSNPVPTKSPYFVSSFFCENWIVFSWTTCTKLWCDNFLFLLGSRTYSRRQGNRSDQLEQTFLHPHSGWLLAQPANQDAIHTLCGWTGRPNIYQLAAHV